jgi:hypothetical protein
MLFDLTGRNLLMKKASDLEGKLSLGAYPDGLYFIRVMQGSNYLKSAKVLKMKSSL